MAKEGKARREISRRARTRRPPGAERRRPVLGEGPADARVFFVGEAPGIEESRTGRPFVGSAGKFLDRVLNDVGLSRAELGRVAEDALKGEATLGGRRVLITAHPAAAMRFPWLGRRFRRDLLKLKRWLRG